MSAKPAGFLSDSFARAISIEQAETPSLAVAFEKAAKVRLAHSGPSRSTAPKLPFG
ncbi:MAG: hypothetical protein ACAH83_03030 [Alphaproteobacteria bacterium]